MYSVDFNEGGGDLFFLEDGRFFFRGSRSGESVLSTQMMEFRMCV